MYKEMKQIEVDEVEARNDDPVASRSLVMSHLFHTRRYQTIVIYPRPNQALHWDVVNQRLVYYTHSL